MKSDCSEMETIFSYLMNGNEYEFFVYAYIGEVVSARSNVINIVIDRSTENMDSKDLDSDSLESEISTDISKIVKVTLSKNTYIYNGKRKKPKVIVKKGKTELKRNKDYTLSYKNNINVGGAFVEINGIGKYKGKITKTFKIFPKGTSITGSVAAIPRGFTIKWKKQAGGITGYQVQYSTSKKFTKKKTTTKNVKSAFTTKLTVKNLKPKKRYYVRIRTYKMIDGKKYCSAWSKCKNIRIKKD